MLALIEAHLILHALATVALAVTAALTALPPRRQLPLRLPEPESAKLISLPTSPAFDTTVRAKAA